MESRDLLNGNKELLLAEFHQLYEIHGRRWRAKLKALSAWHGTDTGYHSWQNAMKGTVGNEPLRLIVADMKAILNDKQASKATIVRKQALVRPAPQSLPDKYPAAHRAARRRASNKKANS